MDALLYYIGWKSKKGLSDKANNKTTSKVSVISPSTLTKSPVTSKSYSMPSVSFSSIHRRDSGVSIDTEYSGVAMPLSHIVNLYDMDTSRASSSTSVYLKHFRLGDFTDIVSIGSGTNSVIYKANLGGQMVVIKMISIESENDRFAVDEFETELSILEHCNHPHIVRYIGCGIHPRRFIVLEYLNEGTIDDHLQNNNYRIPNFLDTLVKGIQLADALDYLHSKCIRGVSILHRDVKPANVGMSGGVLKLFDFGLSIAIKERSSSSEGYEMTGGTGTMRYMAPEVALNKLYSTPADVYSFSILLWQIATNRLPFDRYSSSNFIIEVALGGERPRIDPSWPDAFSSLLRACWSPDQTKRPSFADVKASLEKILLESIQNS
jgi:serine/threonine protein kinase